MKYLIVLLLLLSNIVSAQGLTLKGKVLDLESTRPLANANLLIEGTQTGTATNENGEFSLSGSFNENSFLLVTYIGYSTLRIKTSDLSFKDPNLIKLEPKIISSQTVLVTGSIGKEGYTPMAFSKISRKEISRSYIEQDIPEFLSSLPSTTFYSENGNGIGYNYLSIRGFDQRRISVAINGIPQNDPEDHNVYWLDFPDLLSSTELIQVQRGAGAGIIGYPSVGGSINIITSSFSDSPKFDLMSSVGSYNTRKYSASFSSGLIDNKYSIYAKLSKTLSSGYRDKSWSDFNAYHIAAVRYDKNFTTQVNFFGGPISDGLSYTGLPKFAIKDKELRKENFSDWSASVNSYEYTVPRRSEEIENFSQPHYELLNEWNINPNISFNSALFMVLGSGFYDYDGSWADTSYFRLTGGNGFSAATNPGNSLIRAEVENRQYGWIPRLSINHGNGEFIIGSEVRLHRSLHWGSISFAENLPSGLDKDYKYYQYNGAKDIYNFFAHESYNVNSNLNILAEAQLAFNRYRIYDEKYVGYDFKIDNLFFNPRLGLNYKITPEHNVYLSLARVSREPRLKNYYDAAESSGGAEPQFEKNANGTFNFDNPLVRPETMNDIEAGTSLINENYSLSLNLFYMLFNDEIVKQGQLDRFGQPVTGNVARTIHTGIELTGIIHPSADLELVMNGTISKSYISSGTAFIEFTDPVTNANRIQALSLNDNRIAGFPDMLFNASLRYNSNGLVAMLNARYVGKFYSDNYDNKLTQYLASYPGFLDYEDNQVDAYFTADIFASYEFKVPAFSNSIKVFAQVTNLFDNLYAAYAIGKEFFPAAERGVYGGIQLGL